MVVYWSCKDVRKLSSTELISGWCTWSLKLHRISSRQQKLHQFWNKKQKQKQKLISVSTQNFMNNI